MHLITSIKKKGLNEVVIIFEDEQKITVSLETFLKSGLRKNDNISEDRFSFLLQENKISNCKNDSLKFLARRLHSKFELKIKLLRKKHAPDIIQEVLSHLEKNEILNDYLFAKLITEEKIRNKKLGALKLKSELYKRGIDRKIIDKLISELNNENINENALKVAEKKLNILQKRGIEKEKIKSKLFSYLISKGYEYETVKSIIYNILGESDD